MRNVFVLMLMLLAIPLNAFAFDIRGWWQLEEMPSIFMKINEEKIYGFKYRISKEAEERVEIFVDNSDVPCYLDKKGEDGLLLINALGEQKSYKLVTRDTSLPQKDVRKLCGIEEESPCAPNIGGQGRVLLEYDGMPADNGHAVFMYGL